MRMRLPKISKEAKGDDPLVGRAYAVLLIPNKSGLDEGKKVLVGVAANQKLLPADRKELIPPRSAGNRGK